MYVDSFVLTLVPPDVSAGSIVLGELLDGAFTVAGFPARVEFGGLLELALDDEDGPGAYEVELVLEYSRLEDAPQAPVGQSFTVSAVEPDEDWWGPRLIPLPLQFSLRFWDEFEGYLVVRVNGQEIGEKALRVLHHAVPDGLDA